MSHRSFLLSLVSNQNSKGLHGSRAVSRNQFAEVDWTGSRVTTRNRFVEANGSRVIYRNRYRDKLYIFEIYNFIFDDFSI
jgi:hypothetical protein